MSVFARLAVATSLAAAALFAHAETPDEAKALLDVVIFGKLVPGQDVHVGSVVFK